LPSCFRGGSTPIRPITGRPWLSPSSSTPLLIGLPCGSLSSTLGLCSASVRFEHLGANIGLTKLAREGEGLTTFRLFPEDGLDPAYPPAAPHLRQKTPTASAPGRLPFGSSLQVPKSKSSPEACQYLWLVRTHDVYQQFTFVGHAVRPCTRPPWHWRSQLPLTSRLPSPRDEVPVSQELRTAGLLPPHVLVGHRR